MKIPWTPMGSEVFEEVSASENFKSELGIVEDQGTDAWVILAYCNLLLKHKNTKARDPEEKKQV